MPPQELTPAIPAACFATCNKALIEAESAGKSPEICQADSPFQIAYQSCANCYDANGVDSDELAAIPEFSQWTQYCSTVPVSSVTPPISTSTVSASTPSTSTTSGTTSQSTNSEAIDILTTVYEYTITRESYSRTLTLTDIFTLPQPEDSTRPTNPSSTVNPVSISGSALPETTQSRNAAWIAGPIVGSVAGFAIAVSAALILWCRRRLRHTQRPHEVHEETSTKYEVMSREKPHELAGEPKSILAELPADGAETISRPND
ncbi:hypothetical protein F4778DRAFT_44599 [Xylariomycetidae sp. FL2044]|nr:hypothetical protein F4778DRAFT_44599 [Xylariomycetidae sp. FL2044]